LEDYLRVYAVYYERLGLRNRIEGIYYQIECFQKRRWFNFFRRFYKGKFFFFLKKRTKIFVDDIKLFYFF
jgi:hypothetical protein